MNDQRIIPLTQAELLPLIQQCRGQKYRLVQMHATTLTEGQVEINYSLELSGSLDTLRLTIKLSDMLPSISTYYPGAAFYENEIHDLFGVSFSAMNLDYQGNFYRIAQKTPFAPKPVELTVEPTVEPTASAPVVVPEKEA